MSPKEKFNLKRLLRNLGILVLVLIVLLYLVLPVGMGIAALLPFKDAVGQPPQGFETLTLRAEDGVELQAWYLPATNSVAIILFHGAGDSREGTRGHAEMLARHGYGVLAVDLRGHGESQGKTNRLGWQGTLDVGAAVAYLKGRSEVKSIGGLGLSMGAEILLGAAWRYPELGAIVADGATRRSIEDQLALESERPLVRNFTARVMLATVDLLSGEAPPKPLLESMLESGDTRYLLIAGEAEALEVAYNQLFVSKLDGRATLWIAPQAEHIQAFRVFPQEYEQNVTEFFDLAFYLR